MRCGLIALSETVRQVYAHPFVVLGPRPVPQPPGTWRLWEAVIVLSNASEFPVRVPPSQRFHGTGRFQFIRINGLTFRHWLPPSHLAPRTAIAGGITGGTAVRTSLDVLNPKEPLYGH